MNTIFISLHVPVVNETQPPIDPEELKWIKPAEKIEREALRMRGTILLIGNPAAGYGRTKSRIRELVHILKGRGDQIETYLTTSSGDAQRRARSIEPGVERLVVAGGDGTLNEVVNGLADPSRIPIGLLPTGTSNVMANELSLPRKPEAVAQVLDKGEVLRVDMGLIGERRFLLFVGIGLDAMVTEKLLRSESDGTGHWRYILPVLKVLARYHSPKLRVKVDGREVSGEGLVLVSNTRNYWGILSLADRARCDSGYLDVCVFPKGTLTAFARYSLAAFQARVSKVKAMKYLTGRQILIDSEESVAAQVDGDYYGTTPVLIKLMNAVVPILVP